jgi:hypothetical protein
VTNGDASQQRDKIERFGLAPYFEVMVIEGEVGAGKPDKAVFRYAPDRLGAGPARARPARSDSMFELQAERPGVQIDDREQKIRRAEEVVSAGVDAPAVGSNHAPRHSVAGRDQPAITIETSDPGRCF